MRRRLIVATGTVLAVMLAIVQVASMAAYGDLARVPAVPALIPASLGLAAARAAGMSPLPAAVRAAAARALLHRGDLRTAALVVEALPDSAQAADLRGELAQARGDDEAALVAFVRAGDFERAQRLIDARADIGRLADATLLEQRLADALRGGGQAAVRANALWRLGQLSQSRAVADPARRGALETASLAAYEAALALAPNEETYLLAAGQQALTLGRTALAARYYARALDAVPDSADARAGLERSRR